jgi:hypothetical protein
MRGTTPAAKPDAFVEEYEGCQAPLSRLSDGLSLEEKCVEANFDLDARHCVRVLSRVTHTPRLLDVRVPHGHTSF